MLVNVPGLSDRMLHWDIAKGDITIGSEIQVCIECSVFECPVENLLLACVYRTRYVHTLQDPVFHADHNHSECYHLKPKCLVVDQS